MNPRITLADLGGTPELQAFKSSLDLIARCLICNFAYTSLGLNYKIRSGVMKATSSWLCYHHRSIMIETPSILCLEFELLHVSLKYLIGQSLLSIVQKNQVALIKSLRKVTRPFF